MQGIPSFTFNIFVDPNLTFLEEITASLWMSVSFVFKNKAIKVCVCVKFKHTLHFILEVFFYVICRVRVSSLEMWQIMNRHKNKFSKHGIKNSFERHSVS